MNYQRKAIGLEKTMSKFEGLTYKTFSARKKILKYIVHALQNQQPIHLVNIICPGYQKDRASGVEDFAFKRLSSDIKECPNVLSMIEKLERYMTYLGDKIPEIPIKSTIILADTAILNYKEMQRMQNVDNILEAFSFSIKEYIYNRMKLNNYFRDISFLRMSQMGGYFKKLRIEGYPVDLSMYGMENVRHEVRIKARQYVRELIVDRTSPAKNKTSSFKNMPFQDIVGQSRLEVLRFLYEYGLAGRQIYNSIPQAVMTFAEPSGPMRGYLYNAFIYSDDYLPVIYLP